MCHKEVTGQQGKQYIGDTSSYSYIIYNIIEFVRSFRAAAGYTVRLALFSLYLFFSFCFVLHIVGNETVFAHNISDNFCKARQKWTDPLFWTPVAVHFLFAVRFCVNGFQSASEALIDIGHSFTPYYHDIQLFARHEIIQFIGNGQESSEYASAVCIHIDKW